MGRAIRIGKRKIGNGEPVYIIAEMSGNHNGDIEKAKAIIWQAKECGADAVKLQTYKGDTITLNTAKKDFLIPDDSPWAEYGTLYSLYEKAHTPWSWHNQLFEEGKKANIDVFSSPFDESAINLLEDLNAPCYKIASPEINDVGLIRAAAKTGKPVMLSTGLATLADIWLAVETLKAEGCNDIVILKCTSAYPAPPEEINLKTIPNIAETFDCIAGISDHTLGLGIPIASVAIGAKVIEKHFKLDGDDSSVDAFFSLSAEEFKQMVDEIRKVEKAIGKVDYNLTAKSKNNLRGRRSLYFSKDIPKGGIITVDNIKSVRPGLGMHPKHLKKIIGKKLLCDVEIGERADWKLIDQSE